jgi:HEPN domain-containing protein
MPHERRPPDDPREWINRARSNLVRAQAMLPGVYLEDLCFDAQPAAEKAITAVLIARGAVFPPIHDLAGLLTTLHGLMGSNLVTASLLHCYSTRRRRPRKPPTRQVSVTSSTSSRSSAMSRPRFWPRI